MLKLTLALVTLATAAFGQISVHAQSGSTDAYVKSYVEQQPDIPGMGRAINKIAISFKNMDYTAAIFGVYLRVNIGNGVRAIYKRTVTRPTEGDSITITLILGDAAPLSIDEFYVVPQHQQRTDMLVAPSGN